MGIFSTGEEKRYHSEKYHIYRKEITILETNEVLKVIEFWIDPDISKTFTVRKNNQKAILWADRMKSDHLSNMDMWIYIQKNPRNGLK